MKSLRLPVILSLLVALSFAVGSGAGQAIGCCTNYSIETEAYTDCTISVVFDNCDGTVAGYSAMGDCDDYIH